MHMRSTFELNSLVHCHTKCPEAGNHTQIATSRVDGVKRYVQNRSSALEMCGIGPQALQPSMNRRQESPLNPELALMCWMGIYHPVHSTVQFAASRAHLAMKHCRPFRFAGERGRAAELDFDGMRLGWHSCKARWFEATGRVRRGVCAKVVKMAQSSELGSRFNWNTLIQEPPRQRISQIQSRGAETLKLRVKVIRPLKTA